MHLATLCVAFAFGSAPVTADAPKAPYVEFDFTNMPCEKGSWKLTVEVKTTLKELTYSEDVSAPNGTTREVLCETYATGLRETRFKVEVLNKSKVRVYGATFDGKFYPVTKGSASSPDLKPADLPKVTNPKNEG